MKVEQHDGVMVVRDDLYPGGTKARIFRYLYSRYDEVVYACAAFSRTQVSLATVAAELGKKATIFVPWRNIRTEETAEAFRLGAKVRDIEHGYMSNLQSKARRYCEEYGAYHAPLGFDAPDIIAALAISIKADLNIPAMEVWCAAGSGVLTRTLQEVWPKAAHHAVRVGKECDVGVATPHQHRLKLEQLYLGEVPFPSDRHYDAKAWEVCQREHKEGSLFWNVLG